ncbi:lecithin retinol acyltransferase family protein [Pedobacter helvus]|uniref:Lecithin retinol acyltransferase family protein n=1 Tax=Pedobacter helvus TaxID=2563444 RepID=A0ABW9JKV5_9SPHI|nr:lecithin retinol acyltransferase family protein [Pedobacter ureilyticus]
MTSKLVQEGLMAGDSVVIPKSNVGLIEHYGVYIGTDKMRNHIFAENNVNTGVRLVTDKTFFKNCNSVLAVKKLTGGNVERGKAVQRALSLLGKPYELVNFNCEHYSNYVQNERPNSQQVTKWFWTLLTLIILAISFRQYFKPSTLKFS